MRRINWPGRTLARASPAFIFIAACSLPHADRESAESVNIPDCDTYLSQLHTCLSRLGPEAKTVAQSDVSATRTALLASAKDEASRSSLKATCVTSLERIKNGTRSRVVPCNPWRTV